MIAADLLMEAAALISGPRQADHGTPEDTFRRIAALWSAYLDREVSPTDVCQLMVLLKVGRTLARPKKDDYLDEAGYAGLAHQMAYPTLSGTDKTCATCGHTPNASESFACGCPEPCNDFDQWKPRK